MTHQLSNCKKDEMERERDRARYRARERERERQREINKYREWGY